MTHGISNLIALALALSIAGPAAALQVDWSGTVLSVEADDGTGTFAGTGVGAGFFGSFVYGDTCGVGCSIQTEPDEANYEFSLGSLFGAFVTDGGSSAGGFSASVNIQNDHLLDDDEAALASALLGTTVPPNTPVDVFTLAASTDDTVFDVNDELFDGGIVEVVLGSFDTTLFDDTSFRSQPPSLAEIDFAFFFLSEADTGATVYEVVGSVDSVVPEPGASLLLASVAVSGLVAGRRHR